MDHVRCEESSSSSSVYHASSSDDHPLNGVSFGPLLVSAGTPTKCKNAESTVLSHGSPQKILKKHVSDIFVTAFSNSLIIHKENTKEINV